MRAQRDVGPAVLERVGERPALDVLHGDLEFRAAAGGERIDQRPDVLGDDAGGGDLKLPRLSGYLLHRTAGLLGEAEDLAGQGRQPAASGRQGDAAAVSHEQLVPELLAQRRHRNRHRRLGDLELRGGRLHRPVARDEDK